MGKLHIKMRVVGVILAVFLFSGSNVMAESSATEQLKPTLDELIVILKDESLQGDENKVERRAKIMTTVKKGFDFREMSKRVLGRTWKTISDEQREYFTELMTKLLENVYIGKLEGYSGKELIYSNERQKGSRAQVTTLIEHEGVELPIHYILKNKDDKWMVYDINIEGVSLVRNYMEQFKSILRKDKFEGLVKVIEEKNRSFEVEGSN